MLVLLSSGATRRYRDDIIRVLALPAGTDLQFRYDRRYIDVELLKKIDAGGLRNEEALVLYLWADKEKLYTELVPCRFVTVISAEFAGSSCIVRLRVGNFVADLDDAKFRSSLDTAETELLPAWGTKAGFGPVLNGRFFFPIRNRLLTNATSDITTFENTAIALARHKDFSDPQTTPFYTVRRLIKVDAAKALRAAGLQPRAGTYKLFSGTHYEVEVYSFVPPSVELKSSKLHIDSDVTLVEFPLGNQRDVDSRYDLKRFPFQVPEQIQTVSAGLHFRVTGPENQDDSHSDIIVPVSFTGSLRYAIIRVLLVGIGTSGAGIVAANAADKLNFGNAVLMLFLGLVAAVGTVFTTLK